MAAPSRRAHKRAGKRPGLNALLLQLAFSHSRLFPVVSGAVAVLILLMTRLFHRRRNDGWRLRLKGKSPSITLLPFTFAVGYCVRRTGGRACVPDLRPSLSRPFHTAGFVTVQPLRRAVRELMCMRSLAAPLFVYSAVRLF